MSQALKGKGNGKKRVFHGRVIAIVAITLTSFLLLFLILSFTMAPKGHDIAVGQIAEETIKASRDIVDEYTTDMLREQARDAVSSKYMQDDEITAEVMTSLEGCFSAIGTVREMGEEERLRMEQEAAQNGGAQMIYEIEFLSRCRDVLPNNFSDGNIVVILNMEQEEIDRLSEAITMLVQDALDNGLKESALSEQISNLNQQLISPLNGFSEDAKALGINIISSYLKANFIYDADATEAARDAAEEQVQDVEFKAGRNIVLEGETITQAQFDMLKELGYVKEQDTVWVEYLSIFLVLALIYLALGMFFGTGARDMLQSPKMLFIIAIIVVLTALTAWACSLIHFYIIPVAMAAMTLTLIMVDRTVSLFVNMLLSILAAVITLQYGESAALPVAVAAFLGGAVGIFTISRVYQRAALMLSGVISGLVMAAVYVVFDLVGHIGWMDMLLHGSLGLVSGLMASVLTIGLLPMWETMFKLLTPMKLMELINPNQPLLKKLLMEAPGTYHHSIMVGNMAERAAEAIGANTLIVRAGAYYHDIGKIKRPFFFAENQGADNPHDNIKPDLSARIITSHVTDGYEMVKQHNLPPIIQDMVLQHHGTTPVAYFYHKMKQAAQNPDDVNVNDFRYQGARPRTREAAIIMLADSVEAAVRSIEQPTSKNVEEMIKKIIKNRMDDGQLDFCDLTLREIDIIAKEFNLTLTGMFHDRIEYPDDAK